MTREFVDYALTRFPDEPRFVLARALAADQARAFEAAEGRGGAAEAAHVRDVTARYDAAARFDETAAEARVRKGLFLHRIGRHADALHALDQVIPAQIERELFLAYIHRLVRGRVLEALEKFDEARAAYQAARDALPNAQSPRVALMRLLMRAGDRPAAEALAASIQTASDEAFDPWWLYWLGDYRHYDAIRDRLRERTRS
jgi:tetratricopeptide (TPR) repeat protein